MVVVASARLVIIITTFYLCIIRLMSSIPINSKRIAIVGLNPALQRVVSFSKLSIGDVNRANSVKVGIGGKGQNVVVAASCMKSAVRPDLVQFVGSGREGDTLNEILSETLMSCFPEEEGVSSPTVISVETKQSDVTIRTSYSCRICTTLVDSSSGAVTEIVEPTGVVAPIEYDAMLAAVQAEFATSKALALAAMGSMPPGCSPSTYAQIIKRSCVAESKVVLDTVSGLPDALNACAEIGCSTIIKINAAELYSLTGIGISASEDADIGGTVPSGLGFSTVQELSCSDSSALLVKMMRAQEEAVRKACQVLAGKITGSTRSSSISSSPAGGNDKGFKLYVAMTDGSHRSHLVAISMSSLKCSQHFSISPPQLSRPLVNPIGAGDAVASGTLFGWADAVPSLLHSVNKISTSANPAPSSLNYGDKAKQVLAGDNYADEDHAVLTAFRWGLACGAASCMSESNSVFELQDAISFFNNFRVTRFLV